MSGGGLGNDTISPTPLWWLEDHYEEWEWTVAVILSDQQDVQSSLLTPTPPNSVSVQACGYLS